MWRTLPAATSSANAPTGSVFDGHLGIDAVLVIQIDVVHPEAAQRTLDRGADVFGPTVQGTRRRGWSRDPARYRTSWRWSCASRRPRIALPSRISLNSGPYTSAVSNSVDTQVDRLGDHLGRLLLVLGAG